jgi:flagellar FliJ protein
MMNFRFKLEPVLRFREKREEGLKRELSQLHFLMAKEQARLTELEHVLQQQFEMKRAVQRAQLNVELLTFLEGHCERLRRERTAQRTRVQRAQEAVDQKRQELVRASQEREMLTRLREKQRAEFRAGEERREQKVIDQIAMRQYARQSRAEG